MVVLLGNCCYENYIISLEDTKLQQIKASTHKSRKNHLLSFLYLILHCMQHNKKYLRIYGFTVPHSCKGVHGQDYPKKTQLADVEWNLVAQNIQCCKHGNVTLISYT